MRLIEIVSFFLEHHLQIDITITLYNRLLENCNSHCQSRLSFQEFQQFLRKQKKTKKLPKC